MHPEGFADNSDSPSGKITPQMTETAYTIAKQVYDGQLGRTEGKDEIIRATGMVPGSVSDYISDLLYMMDSKAYARTLNDYATRYFLGHIRLDYGEAAFQKALDACKKTCRILRNPWSWQACVCGANYKGIRVLTPFECEENEWMSEHPGGRMSNNISVTLATIESYNHIVGDIERGIKLYELGGVTFAKDKNLGHIADISEKGEHRRVMTTFTHDGSDIKSFFCNKCALRSSGAICRHVVAGVLAIQGGIEL